MILRLLALIGVIYLVVKGARLWLSVVQSGRKIVRAEADLSQIDDVMVKDPYCNVYFPKRDGVHVRVNGEDLFFCSHTCRDKFLAEQK